MLTSKKTHTHRIVYDMDKMFASQKNEYLSIDILSADQTFTERKICEIDI